MQKRPSFRIPSSWQMQHGRILRRAYQMTFAFLNLSIASASFKCKEVGECYGRRRRRGITAHEIPEELNPNPSSGNSYAAMKNGCRAGRVTCSLSLCSLRGLARRFIHNRAVVKVSAWSQIHNHACETVQFHSTPIDKSPAETRSANPRSPRVD